ncbi:MAG: phosphonate ABC transporter ATP-binding protein [Paracoccaceae bacterium]|uniref:phosphonate ABC transporter ATP-binding protein n=1 Tax=Celeribacter marinus TaxID=1397108 RepID=UPI00317BC82D
MTKNTVHIEDLSYFHTGAQTPSIDQLSLDIAEGECVALLGPSGAGKTTLLTLLDGRLRNWLGQVSVLGTDFDPVCSLPLSKRADTGFVFQEFGLVERSTVIRNVLNGRLGRMPFWRALRGKASDLDLEVALAALGNCAIADLAERRVDTLSGGQRQRVAIARCLAQEPRLILADEPVSNLDPARAEDILSLLKSAAQARGATTVFSSHQPDLARRFADRIIGMRNGRIAFSVRPQELSEDATSALYGDAQNSSSAKLKVVN